VTLLRRELRHRTSIRGLCRPLAVHERACQTLLAHDERW